MQIEQIKNIKSEDEARQFAIAWQGWQAEQNMSYEEVAEWQHAFRMLAGRFDLWSEFEENGII